MAEQAGKLQTPVAEKESLRSFQYLSVDGAEAVDGKRHFIINIQLHASSELIDCDCSLPRSKCEHIGKMGK